MIDFTAEDQGDHPTYDQTRAKRQTAVLSAESDRHPHSSSGHAGDQQSRGQHLPSTPGTKECKQLVISPAQALNTADDVEELSYRPERHISHHYPCNRVVQRREYAEIVGNQTEPKGWKCNRVWEQHILQVDQAKGYEHPQQPYCGTGSRSYTVVPGQRRGEEGGCQLNGRVSDADLGTAA